MRVTSNMTASDSIYNIQQNQNRLYKLNEQLGTQNNINRPSDDPLNAKLLLDVTDKVKADEQYLSNIKKADTWQKLTSTTLTAIASFVAQAKRAVATVTSGSDDATMRQGVVSQLQSLKQQIVDMGNVQLGDQYIFGGTKNSEPPFSTTPSSYYTGNEGAITVEIGNNNTQQINIDGKKLLTADTASPQPYGNTNILQTLDNLITEVSANNVPAITAGALALEAGAKQINNAQSDVAARVARLDATTKMIENNRNTLENIYSSTQNADTAKLGVQLSQQQTAYEASLSATAKLTQLSLLDYL